MINFFKRIFQFFITLLVDIFLIILCIIAGFFVIIEAFFGFCRQVFVSIIVGIAEARIDRKKVLPLVRSAE